MGDLIKTPHSEVTATLELLAHFGVNSEHFEKLRKASSWVQQQVAQAIIASEESYFTERFKKIFETFKAIKLGTYGDASKFRKALEKAGIQIGSWGSDILNKVTVGPRESIELVRVTVAELGFAKGATRQEIYQRAFDLGLSLCPAEVGPQLRLQYKDQPMGEWLLIGMEPIADSDGYPLVFLVERGRYGLWLSGRYGLADGFWNPDGVWVFARRK